MSVIKNIGMSGAAARTGNFNRKGIEERLRI